MNEEIYTGNFYWTTACVVFIYDWGGSGSSVVQARVVYQYDASLAAFDAKQ